MLQYDFDQSIGYWLSTTTQVLHRAFNDELAPHKITYRQAQVLLWLMVDGEMSQAELAARMTIEPPTLVGILDRMELAGWIARRGCPCDRRKKLIAVCAAAEPIWEKVVDCAREIRARATRGLSPRQQATLKTLLQKVRSNFETPLLAEVNT